MNWFEQNVIEIGEPVMVIMRGLPGSGKSTLINNYIKRPREEKRSTAELVCSADDYFMDSAERYKFDPERLEVAHTTCFDRAMSACLDNYSPPWVIFIDNTHATRAEYMPYVMLARATGRAVYLVRVACSPILCAARNTHGVAEKSINRMSTQWESRLSFDPPEFVIDDIGRLT